MQNQKHTLPQLPYAHNALEPFIDEQTMLLHHTKHHQAYIDKLNLALDKYPNLSDKSLEELLGNLEEVPEDIRVAVRNHGGGHYNHSLFWQMLAPSEVEGMSPTGKFLQELEKTFGTLADFKELFSKTALNQFGSGWGWLVLNKNKKLVVYSTSNQDNPLTQGDAPLLGIDIWEHAYYLKYQNKRQEYIGQWWNVVNWKYVEDRYRQNL